MPGYPATTPKPPASTKWRKIEKSGEKWFPGSLQDFHIHFARRKIREMTGKSHCPNFWLQFRNPPPPQNTKPKRNIQQLGVGNNRKQNGMKIEGRDQQPNPRRKTETPRATHIILELRIRTPEYFLKLALKLGNSRTAPENTNNWND